MARVLTIEDDAVTAREIVTELKRRGNEVDWVDNGAAGLKRAAGGGYDAITLDRMLPGLDGLAVVTALRDAGVQTPVLMISALSDVDERVRGLRAGGDDYLTKPFAPDEMVARIEVLLRRRRATDRETILRVADLELDRIARSARRGETELELLPIEFRLLDVYDVAKLGEKFDLVIFMGVLYHLRHPLLALDLIREHVAGDMLLFQTMQQGSNDILQVPEDHPFHVPGTTQSPTYFDNPAYPKMHFIEREFAHDWTNWWAPNAACSQAMLRAAGFTIEAQPEPEVYLCRVAPVPYEQYGPAAVYPAQGGAA